MTDDPRFRDGRADGAEYRRHVEAFIRQLGEAEGALQALAAGELDAVVDPGSAAPILLSRAQEALARSEERYRDLIARCPALVCELAPDGEILFVNEAVRALLGYEPDELVEAERWTRLVPSEHAALVGELRTRLATGDVTGFEMPLRAADGQPRWILWNTSNRYDDEGRLASIVAFGIDITDRKGAETTNRQLGEERVARAAAEAANRAKTEFLAVMSHELRTPLNAIAGYAELMEMGVRGPTTPEQLEDLRRIRRSQRHLLGLINDILSFARLDAGHVRFAYEDVPVNETLAVLDALTEPQVRAKGIRYKAARCEPTLTVWADREKLRQILINLVSNAIKFTEAGGSIAVECWPTPEAVEFSVRDTGRGIPPDKLSAIFEPFVQVNKQYTRDQDGVGLGLAISRDLARAMNGDIAVNSRLGAGSRFTVRLPRTRPG